MSAVGLRELSSFSARPQLCELQLSRLTLLSPAYKVPRSAWRDINVTRQNIGAPHGGLPFSPAVRAGDFVFVSGQIPRDAKGGVHMGSIEEQTEAAIVQITRILNEAGCSLADVVKVTVFLEDARDFASFNKVYAQHFSGMPARSTVEARLMVDAKIEIEAIAYRSNLDSRQRSD
jgi:2-iminobutanoate/2-iminopropanoate deaminase